MLRLSFDDAEYTASLIRTYGRVADFRDKHRHDPQADDAKAVLQFLDQVEELGLKELVLYCENGMSRSASIAQFVNRTRGATVSGGVLKAFNETLYYLLGNPMGYETILRNMEKQEQEEDTLERERSTLASLFDRAKKLLS
ncbi:hypothetical protein [Halomonas sp. I5-271120]|uniref:hypothetical protein n=1 Tax=Halomonas sp. I5-271120 TaxID=3061632 RepID=UPI0027153BB4|nr:hypothetical protein [Halomonas sp. I5-271120]